MLDLEAIRRGLSEAWKSGEVRPTHQKKDSAERTWRTRADPFASTWPMVERWLNEEPAVTDKQFFKRLRELMPDYYPSAGQLRTLQRRVQAWHAEQARQLAFGVLRAQAVSAPAPLA